MEQNNTDNLSFSTEESLKKDDKKAVSSVPEVQTQVPVEKQESDSGSHGLTTGTNATTGSTETGVTSGTYKGESAESAASSKNKTNGSANQVKPEKANTN